MLLESGICLADSISKRRTMKTLTCRKCEGHGLQVPLKGHAPSCPFNNCRCDTCSAVMNMRASALIRRFRHRRPDKSNALLQTIRSKNGNTRLRIVAKGEPTLNVPELTSTEIHYSTSVSPPASSLGSASPFSTPSDSLAPSPPLHLPSPTPISADLLRDYLQQLLISSIPVLPQLPPPMPSPFLLSEDFALASLRSQLLVQQLLQYKL